MTDDDDTEEILALLLGAMDDLRAEIVRLEEKDVDTHRLRNIAQTFQLNIQNLQFDHQQRQEKSRERAASATAAQSPVRLSKNRRAKRTKRAPTRKR
jgi:hypothetical protein